ncbi:MAG: ECF-type sigma factor [Acidobacteriota bacterium]
MQESRSGEITRLLAQIAEGNTLAAEELIPLVYNELRLVARAHLSRESRGDLPQPTELVHEAYLRLIKDQPLKLENRRHFFAAAGEAMRRILIERARRAARKIHGGEFERVSFGDFQAPGTPKTEELLALDEALERLEARDALMGDVVKLRFFVGMSIQETADALGISTRSVNRFWTGARAWLQREISGPAKGDSAG